MGLTHDWGSTADERGDTYPCDPLLQDPDLVLHRAIDVDAPPAICFRWLCQLRAAPYSYDWIDNWGRRSPPVLTPGLEQLEVGQRVMHIFRLASFETDRHLTLSLDDRASARVFGRIAVTYLVRARESGARLIVRLCVERPSGVTRWLSFALPAGDLVMMRRQLLNLKALAERSASHAAAL